MSSASKFNFKLYKDKYLNHKSVDNKSLLNESSINCFSLEEELSWVEEDEKQFESSKESCLKYFCALSVEKKQSQLTYKRLKKMPL